MDFIFAVTELVFLVKGLMIRSNNPTL